MKIILRDDENGEFAFAGVRIAEASTQEGGGKRSRRWSELAIYRQDAGGYVLHEVGRSKVEGEVDRSRITRGETARDLFSAIQARRRLTAVDSDLFAAAAEADAEFASTIGDDYDVEELSAPALSPLITTGQPFQEFTLDRDGGRALRFRGIALAHESSRADAPAWMEVRIFRTIDGRYVTQKARYSASSPESPEKSAVVIVDDGAAAFRSLVRQGSGWVESSVLDAMHAAAKRDKEFSESLGDLLDRSNFRRIVTERTVSNVERRVLEAMMRGGVIVADTTPGRAPRLLGWEGVSSSELPHPRVFMALSRDRMIRKCHSDNPNELTSRWEIGERGRQVFEKRAGEPAKETP